jgi:serine O-acetyltransferase
MTRMQSADTPSDPTAGVTAMQAVRGDLYRYDGASGLAGFLRCYLREPGFRFTFWLRMSGSLPCGPLGKLLRPIARVRRHHLEIRYGISIPREAKIGPGLFIGHFGGIVVHPCARIGANCNLSHDVTLGQINCGKHKGFPTVGRNVYIGPGARVLGNVNVGDGSAIGANAVVLNDVEPNGVAVGIPARVVSDQGSAGYVEFTDYQ